jgi:hypothetical protein
MSGCSTAWADLALACSVIYPPLPLALTALYLMIKIQDPKTHKVKLIRAEDIVEVSLAKLGFFKNLYEIRMRDSHIHSMDGSSLEAVAKQVFPQGVKTCRITDTGIQREKILRTDDLVEVTLKSHGFFTHQFLITTRNGHTHQVAGSSLETVEKAIMG